MGKKRYFVKAATGMFDQVLPIFCFRKVLWWVGGWILGFRWIDGWMSNDNVLSLKEQRGKQLTQKACIWSSCSWDGSAEGWRTQQRELVWWVWSIEWCHGGKWEVCLWRTQSTLGAGEESALKGLRCTVALQVQIRPFGSSFFSVTVLRMQ